MRSIIRFISLLTLILFSSSVIADTHEDTVIKSVESQHRQQSNRQRDIYRHPAETLSFFGLKSDMKVLEILPGRGWYTEILAPILKDKGHLTVASFGENNPNDYLAGVHKKFAAMMAENPTVYGKVEMGLFQEKGYLDFVEDNSMDMVVTFRNSHNWIRYGGIEEIFKAFHRVLKLGGTLGVVQHRADKGSDAKVTAEKGYVPESFIIKLAESYGFELVAKSEINANPKDTKNHPEGVWTLPPAYRLKDVDKEKYQAIGESDRMTLKFIKLK